MNFALNFILKNAIIKITFKNIVYMIKNFLIHVFILMYGFSAFSQTCQPNDPYDQIVSDFHSTVARRQDGTLVIWGEKKASNGIDHVLKPQVINSTNYPGLTGRPIRASLGSRNGSFPGLTQAILLTTTGLFAWGDIGTVIDDKLTTSSTFQKISVGGKADGLPEGVSPLDVKIMTATYRSLAIVTTKGNVWILGVSYQMYGDGSTSGIVKTDIWHLVQSSSDPNTELKGIVQFRMSTLMCFAVDSNNVMYTWGNRIINQNNITSSTRAVVIPRPPEMANEMPKMIASTSQTDFGPRAVTYFILTQKGELYSMGDNRPAVSRTTGFTSWGRVRKNATDNLENVMYISAQESDAISMSVAAITSDNNLWAWGDNDHSMIGGDESNSSFLYPRTPNGFTMNQDKANYVEMGGHTLVYVKDGADRYCYVGHRINGSMGDGTDTDIVESSLNCTNTPAIPLCSLCPATMNNKISNSQTVCEGYPVSTIDSETATLTNNNSVFYQWQSSTNGKDAAFQDIKGATDKNYAPSPLTKTTRYRRIVKNTTPNCPVDSSNVIQVFINPLPVKPLVLTDKDVCAGDSIVLNASIADNITYSWTGPHEFKSSLSKPVIYNSTGINSGVYKLNVTDEKNCTSDTSISNVMVHTIAFKIATPITYCEGQSILLSISEPEPLWSYLWTGPDGFVSNKTSPLITNAGVDKMGTYTLTISDERKCATTESITLTLADCEDSFTIPEGFSPNGDGVNDYFVIRGLSNYPTHSIIIYNRWGVKVYQASPYKNDWQGISQFGVVVGEFLPEGTYFYLMDKNNGEEPIKGSIYLKR